MGHIVKAGQARATAAGGASESSDRVGAQVTEVLLAARVRAQDEWSAAEGAAVLLARKMAEKIIGRMVDVDPTVMAGIAAQALQACRPHGACLILRTHPEDLAALERTRPLWLAAGEVQAPVKLIADASVGRYGCVVETSAGRLDARLRTQLDVLERALRAPPL